MQLQNRSPAPLARLATWSPATGRPVTMTPRTDRSIGPASMPGSTSWSRRPRHRSPGTPGLIISAASLAQAICDCASTITTGRGDWVSPVAMQVSGESGNKLRSCQPRAWGAGAAVLVASGHDAAVGHVADDGTAAGRHHELAPLKGGN